MVGATPQLGVIASWGSSVRGRARRRAISPVASSHPTLSKMQSRGSHSQHLPSLEDSIRSLRRPKQPGRRTSPYGGRQPGLMRQSPSNGNHFVNGALGHVLDLLQQTSCQPWGFSPIICSRDPGGADSLRTVIFSRRPLTQACGSTEIAEGCLHLPDTSLQEKFVRLSLK